MEHNKKKTSSSSSSSFTMDLFGPKDSSPSSSSSTGIFGSVFGPHSMGLGKDSSVYGAAKRQDFGSQYGNAKQGISDNYNNSQRKRGESGGKQSKDRSSTYQNETSEPSYLSSSIYYGGQEVYSPNTHTKTSHHATKKDVGGDDSHGSNSNSASHGNWWEGSLYY